ncbi:MAG: DNA mismatch repair protein MutS [Polyangiaceae bacterium]
MTSIREHYERRLRELDAELAALGKQSDALSRTRGITFLATVAAAVVILVRGLPPWVWVSVGIGGAFFVFLVVKHALLASKRALVEERATINRRGLGRLAGEAEPERPGDTFGERFLKADHPYAGDLDLFGKASLFRAMSRAETAIGEETLARWLLAPGTPEEIRARQEAARELTKHLQLLEDLAVHARRAESRNRAEDPLLSWAEAPAELPVPGNPNAPADAQRRAPLVLAAKILVPLTVVLFVASFFLKSVKPILAYVYVPTLVLQAFVLVALFGALGRMLGFVTSRETPFGRYQRLFELIENAPFESPLLAELSKLLRGEGGATASKEIARLERGISFADVRHNVLIHTVLSLGVLYDVWCGLALESWRAASGRKARGWLRAVGTLEALASLAVFAAEHDEYAWPEVEDGAPCFEVEALGHPLIDREKRVSNTHTIDGPGTALLITGSNMSGKSTWLRSMGLCAVMAMTGSVVAAKRARVSRLEVWTSMRIKDSLEQGLSHFYAEILRLKAIQDATAKSSRVFFLLDEVLHGTNSRERTAGAKSVVLCMIDRGAIGAVSSHDLHLASLEEESEGRVTNWHFSDTITAGRMVFDYQLKRGVVQSTNALRLMRLVGLAVQAGEAPELEAEVVAAPATS